MRPARSAVAACAVAISASFAAAAFATPAFATSLANAVPNCTTVTHTNVTDNVYHEAAPKTAPEESITTPQEGCG